MGRVAKELGALAVSRLSDEGLHFVGGVPGLALQVLPTGGRTWLLRAMVGAKRREIGLGGYPGVTLAAAREAAREARKLIVSGVDPVQKRREARSALRAAQAAAMTFKKAAEGYITAHESGWRNAKHGQQWRNTLKTYAYPVVGDLLVRDVGLPQVLEILEPIWSTKTETASRVRSRVELVLDWAASREHREGPNPARWRGHLDKLLPKPRKVAQVVNRPALPVGQVGQFMVGLRQAEGMGARALEFAILTAARSGEVRGATWAEIDLDAALWIVPGERMKSGKEHRVPLSRAAVALLKRVPRMVGTNLVFPSAKGGKLSDMTIGAVMRRMELEAVPHGFRSTFRDWAAERTNYPNELAEMALAHSIGNKVEAAYRRGDMLEKRRRMMEDWARFCGRPEVSAKVHVLVTAA